MIAMILYLALMAHMGEPNKFQFQDWIAITPDQRANYVDIPAIQETRQVCQLSKTTFLCAGSSLGSACPCPYEYQPAQVWTCADKSRVLLTSEDGVRHCIRF